MRHRTNSLVVKLDGGEAVARITVTLTRKNLSYAMGEKVSIY